MTISGQLEMVLEMVQCHREELREILTYIPTIEQVAETAGNQLNIVCEPMSYHMEIP